MTGEGTERAVHQALAGFAVGAVPLVQAPGPDAARRRARQRRRNRRAAWAAAAALVLVAGVGGFLANRPRPVSAPADQPSQSAESAPGTAAPGTPPASPPAASGTGTATATPPPGVAYDPKRIPAGSAGYSERRIAPAGDSPTPGDNGIFRTECAYSHMRPDDPVGRPGAPGRVPLYMFWGNTATTAGSTPESLLARGNSTCRGGIVDRSAYYVPALINAHTRTPVAPSNVSVYFDSGQPGVDPASVRPFPPGLRMIAGDPAATGSQPVGGWTCLPTYTGVFGSVPTTCPAGKVELRLYFPQCWDGVRLDSPDHRSHVAYAANGRCPAGHPVALPEISYHLAYDLGADAASYRLATDTYPAGRPGGASVHGYWVNGWESDIQAVWISRCVKAKVSCGSHLLGDGRQLTGVGID